uniref:Transmembrane protein n=1 Tax=Neospora caninum (strain Liverpool) TaxID=572307 RepID=A0A0F7U8L7_NEOCL|nr:TPA: hypothetical protein BN1204_020045 [Neospora caninum Liverpool]
MRLPAFRLSSFSLFLFLLASLGLRPGTGRLIRSSPRAYRVGCLYTAEPSPSPRPWQTVVPTALPLPPVSFFFPLLPPSRTLRAYPAHPSSISPADPFVSPLVVSGASASSFSSSYAASPPCFSPLDSGASSLLPNSLPSGTDSLFSSSSCLSVLSRSARCHAAASASRQLPKSPFTRHFFSSCPHRTPFRALLQAPPYPTATEEGAGNRHGRTRSGRKGKGEERRRAEETREREGECNGDSDCGREAGTDARDGEGDRGGRGEHERNKRKRDRCLHGKRIRWGLKVEGLDRLVPTRRRRREFLRLWRFCAASCPPSPLSLSVALLRLSPASPLSEAARVYRQLERFFFHLNSHLGRLSAARQLVRGPTHIRQNAANLRLSPSSLSSPASRSSPSSVSFLSPLSCASDARFSAGSSGCSSRPKTAVSTLSGAARKQPLRTDRPRAEASLGQEERVEKERHRREDARADRDERRATEEQEGTRREERFVWLGREKDGTEEGEDTGWVSCLPSLFSLLHRRIQVFSRLHRMRLRRRMKRTWALLRQLQTQNGGLALDRKAREGFMAGDSSVHGAGPRSRVCVHLEPRAEREAHSAGGERQDEMMSAEEEGGDRETEQGREKDSEQGVCHVLEKGPANRTAREDTPEETDDEANRHREGGQAALQSGRAGAALHGEGQRLENGEAEKEQNAEGPEGLVSSLPPWKTCRGASKQAQSEAEKSRLKSPLGRDDREWAEQATPLISNSSLLWSSPATVVPARLRLQRRACNLLLALRSADSPALASKLIERLLKLPLVLEPTAAPSSRAAPHPPGDETHSDTGREGSKQTPRSSPSSLRGLPPLSPASSPFPLRCLSPFVSPGPSRTAGALPGAESDAEGGESQEQRLLQHLPRRKDGAREEDESEFDRALCGAVYLRALVDAQRVGAWTAGRRLWEKTLQVSLSTKKTREFWREVAALLGTARALCASLVGAFRAVSHGRRESKRTRDGGEPEAFRALLAFFSSVFPSAGSSTGAKAGQEARLTGKRAHGDAGRRRQAERTVSVGKGETERTEGWGGEKTASLASDREKTRALLLAAIVDTHLRRGNTREATVWGLRLLEERAFLPRDGELQVRPEAFSSTTSPGAASSLSPQFSEKKGEEETRAAASRSRLAFAPAALPEDTLVVEKVLRALALEARPREALALFRLTFLALKTAVYNQWKVVLCGSEQDNEAEGVGDAGESTGGEPTEEGRLDEGGDAGRDAEAFEGKDERPAAGVSPWSSRSLFPGRLFSSSRSLDARLRHALSPDPLPAFPFFSASASASRLSDALPLLVECQHALRRCPQRVLEALGAAAALLGEQAAREREKTEKTETEEEEDEKKEAEGRGGTRGAKGERGRREQRGGGQSDGGAREATGTGSEEGRERDGINSEVKRETEGRRFPQGRGEGNLRVRDETQTPRSEASSRDAQIRSLLGLTAETVELLHRPGTEGSCSHPGVKNARERSGESGEKPPQGEEDAELGNALRSGEEEEPRRESGGERRREREERGKGQVASAMKRILKVLPSLDCVSQGLVVRLLEDAGLPRLALLAVDSVLATASPLSSHWREEAEKGDSKAEREEQPGERGGERWTRPQSAKAAHAGCGADARLWCQWRSRLAAKCAGEALQGRGNYAPPETRGKREREGGGGKREGQDCVERIAAESEDKLRSRERPDRGEKAEGRRQEMDEGDGARQEKTRRQERLGAVGEEEGRARHCQATRAPDAVPIDRERFRALTAPVRAGSLETERGEISEHDREEGGEADCPEGTEEGDARLGDPPSALTSRAPLPFQFTPFSEVLSRRQQSFESGLLHFLRGNAASSPEKDVFRRMRMERQRQERLGISCLQLWASGVEKAEERREETRSSLACSADPRRRVSSLDSRQLWREFLEERERRQRRRKWRIHLMLSSRVRARMRWAGSLPGPRAPLPLSSLPFSSPLSPSSPNSHSSSSPSSLSSSSPSSSFFVSSGVASSLLRPPFAAQRAWVVAGRVEAPVVVAGLMAHAELRRDVPLLLSLFWALAERKRESTRAARARHSPQGTAEATRETGELVEIEEAAVDDLAFHRALHMALDGYEALGLPALAWETANLVRTHFGDSRKDAERRETRSQGEQGEDKLLTLQEKTRTLVRDHVWTEAANPGGGAPFLHLHPSCPLCNSPPSVRSVRSSSFLSSSLQHSSPSSHASSPSSISSSSGFIPPFSPRTASPCATVKACNAVLSRVCRCMRGLLLSAQFSPSTVHSLKSFAAALPSAVASPGSVASSLSVVQRLLSRPEQQTRPSYTDAGATLEKRETEKRGEHRGEKAAGDADEAQGQERGGDEKAEPEGPERGARGDSWDLRVETLGTRALEMIRLMLYEEEWPEPDKDTFRLVLRLTCLLGDLPSLRQLLRAQSRLAGLRLPRFSADTPSTPNLRTASARSPMKASASDPSEALDGSEDGGAAPGFGGESPSADGDAGELSLGTDAPLSAETGDIHGGSGVPLARARMHAPGNGEPALGLPDNSRSPRSSEGRPRDEPAPGLNRLPSLHAPNVTQRDFAPDEAETRGEETEQETSEARRTREEPPESWAGADPTVELVRRFHREGTGRGGDFGGGARPASYALARQVVRLVELYLARRHRVREKRDQENSRLPSLRSPAQRENRARENRGLTRSSQEPAARREYSAEGKEKKREETSEDEKTQNRNDTVEPGEEHDGREEDDGEEEEGEGEDEGEEEEDEGEGEEGGAEGEEGGGEEGDEDEGEETEEGQAMKREVIAWLAANGLWKLLPSVVKWRTPARVTSHLWTTRESAENGKEEGQEEEKREGKSAGVGIQVDLRQVPPLLVEAALTEMEEDLEKEIAMLKNGERTFLFFTPGAYPSSVAAARLDNLRRTAAVFSFFHRRQKTRQGDTFAAARIERLCVSLRRHPHLRDSLLLEPANACTPSDTEDVDRKREPSKARRAEIRERRGARRRQRETGEDRWNETKEERE